MTHIPPGFANVQVIWELADDTEGLCNMGFQVTSFDPVTDLDAADEATSNWQWNGQLASNTDYLGIKVLIGTTGDPLTFESRAHGVLGTGGNSLPANTTVLVTKRTARGGRKGRGRMFLPGVRETLIGDNGNMDPTDQASLTDGVQDWLDAMEPIMGGPAHLLHTEELDSPDPLIAVQVEQKVATQRRRLRR